MAKRYPKYEIASKIVIAGELAKLGARTKVLRYTTQFPIQTIRKIIRDATGLGPITGPYGDPQRWFSELPDRLVHGKLFLHLHTLRKEKMLALRLLKAYRLYLEVVPSPILDINMAFGIIFLKEHGLLHQNKCAECDSHFVTIKSNTGYCQACTQFHLYHCRTCNAPLPHNGSNKGRKREYCDSCNQLRAKERIKRCRKEQLLAAY